MTIVYKKTTLLPNLAIQHLYDDDGWTAYTKDMLKLVRAIRSSLAVVTAWDGENLVGLVRAVGDGQTILYVQDILVLKNYRRRGIGSVLLNKVLEAYPHVRQKVLLTDDGPVTREFYEANGFKSCDKGELVAFARFD